MDDELPMSVRSELAEARAVADRCPRLEMFATEPREGWTTWGNGLWTK